MDWANSLSGGPKNIESSLNVSPKNFSNFFDCCLFCRCKSLEFVREFLRTSLLGWGEEVGEGWKSEDRDSSFWLLIILDAWISVPKKCCNFSLFKIAARFWLAVNRRTKLDWDGSRQKSEEDAWGESAEHTCHWLMSNSRNKIIEGERRYHDGIPRSSLLKNFGRESYCISSKVAHWISSNTWISKGVGCAKRTVIWFLRSA